jgi:hypothetical protein
VTARKITKAARCSVCNHADRVLIESTRIAGASLDTIAAKYTVSRDAIWRHMGKHVSEDLRAEYLAAVPLKELAAKAAAEGVSVLEHFSIVRSVLMQQFQLASSVNDRNAVGSLAGRLTEVLRAIANITGEMGALANSTINIHGNINVLNSPVFATLQANMLTALAPFPDARAAVVAALRKIDEQNPLAESATRVVDHVAST